MAARGTSDGSYLAFDTSGLPGSVVLGGQPPVLLGDRDEVAGRLVPAIDEVLAGAEVEVGDLDGIVVGEGPGSFTGVRVSAATAKALAGALGVPLWSVSSLAATATASGINSVQYVLFDARADRVYGACYDVGPTSVETLIPPHGGQIEDVFRSELPEGCVFTGEGAVKHRDMIRDVGFEVETSTGNATSSAEGLLRYLELHPDLEAVEDLASWEPRYIRASSVERVWSG